MISVLIISLLISSLIIIFLLFFCFKYYLALERQRADFNRYKMLSLGFIRDATSAIEDRVVDDDEILNHDNVIRINPRTNKNN